MFRSAELLLGTSKYTDRVPVLVRYSPDFREWSDFSGKFVSRPWPRLGVLVISELLVVLVQLLVVVDGLEGLMRGDK